MKKNQLKGIFTELNETSTRKSAFTTFVETEDISIDVTQEKSEIGLIRKRVYEELQKLKEEYIDLIKDPKVQELFARLEKMETAIVQHRSILVTDVKLTLLNQKRGGSETSYVVARAPFYNPNNVKAEIRAYMGKAEDFGNDLVKLANDPEFMKRAELELVSSMEEFMIIYDTLPKTKKLKKGQIPMTKEEEEEAEEFLKQFVSTPGDKKRIVKINQNTH